MKSLLSFVLLCSFFTACNNRAIEEDGTANNSDTTAGTTAALPYPVTQTPDWEKGPIENVAIAMNALKAYETNDSNAMREYFADSVEFHVDGYSFEGTRDSFLLMLQNHRNDYSNVVFRMHDYESVKSKARNEEWVGLWYTETNTHKNGKVDSSFVMDDIQIKNGKVWEIDSKMRRLPKAD